VLGTGQDPKMRMVTGSWHFERGGILALLRSSALRFLLRKLRSTEVNVWSLVVSLLITTPVRGAVYIS